MYGKIFTSIYEGTLYGKWEALVTFQQLIVLCDADGIVDMTPHAISARTSIPLKIIKKGLEILSTPDPYSRTPDQEGRRIELIDAHRPWGWHLVNHTKYQHMQDAETLRSQTRERVRKHRESRRLSSDSVTVTDGNARKRHTDTDTDTDTKSKNKAQAPFVLPDWIPEVHWQAWLEARTKARKTPTDYAKRLAVLKLDNLREQGHAPDQVLMASAFNGWSGLFPPKEIK